MSNFNNGGLRRRDVDNDDNISVHSSVSQGHRSTRSTFRQPVHSESGRESRRHYGDFDGARSFAGASTRGGARNGAGRSVYSVPLRYAGNAGRSGTADASDDAFYCDYECDVSSVGVDRSAVGQDRRDQIPSSVGRYRAPTVSAVSSSGSYRSESPTRNCLLAIRAFHRDHIGDRPRVFRYFELEALCSDSSGGMRECLGCGTWRLDSQFYRHLMRSISIYCNWPTVLFDCDHTEGHICSDCVLIPENTPSSISIGFGRY